MFKIIKGAIQTDCKFNIKNNFCRMVVASLSFKYFHTYHQASRTNVKCVIHFCGKVSLSSNTQYLGIVTHYQHFFYMFTVSFFCDHSFRPKSDAPAIKSGQNTILKFTVAMSRRILQFYHHIKFHRASYSSYYYQMGM
jgi:hypothetical protein